VKVAAAPSPSSMASTPDTLGARCDTSEYATYTPSMKNEPCAKLTMRLTPKISDKPAATKNKDEAEANPLRA